MTPLMVHALPEMVVPPLIVFLIVVAPAWLWLHYRRGGSKADIEQLEGAISALSANAQRLERRIATLESALLDAEHRYVTRV